jgi:hypothetical protein
MENWEGKKRKKKTQGRKKENSLPCGKNLSDVSLFSLSI